MSLNFNFTIDKKITPIRIGDNKIKFAIDKTGTTNINITQDKIEDVLYSVFETKDDFDLVRVITNIKGKQKIPELYFKGIGSNKALVTDQGCGFHDTTTLVFEDVNIEVEKKELGLELCFDQFVNTSLEVHIKPGGLNEAIDIEDALLAYLTEFLKDNVQSAAFEDQVQGLFPKILADGTALSPSSSSTPSDILMELYSALPRKWRTSRKTEPVIFISDDFMTLMRNEIKNSQASVVSNIEVIDDRFRLPLTRALVVTSPYLSGKSAIAGISNFLFVATDLESDFEDIRIWYSQDNGTLRFQAKPYLGTAIADIENFIYYVA